MLIKTLLVTLLSGLFYLQLAMAEEAPPPAAATEPVQVDPGDRDQPDPRR